MSLKNLFILVLVIAAFTLGVIFGSSIPNTPVTAEAAEQVIVTETKTIYVPVEVVKVQYVEYCPVPTEQYNNRPVFPKGAKQVDASSTSTLTASEGITSSIGPITATPEPATTPVVTEEEKETKPPCNRGDGNGGEGCDPGNSGGQGKDNSPYPPEKEDNGVKDKEDKDNKSNNGNNNN